MKKLLSSGLIALILCGTSLPVFADTQTVNVPMNEKGEQADPMFAGYKYFRLPVNGAPTTEQLVCSGLCLLADVIMESGAATSNLQFRDTLTADGFAGGATTVLKLAFQTQDSTSVQNTRLRTPIRFQNGIAVKLSALTLIGEGATILYLPIGPANK